MASLPDKNLLAGETSPYLRQHADNPVHWRPWSRAALDEAQAQGRPILLSIGYAACHWCHVMAHESFEDEAVAAVMNRLFVNIKVDREERPDIDQIHMAALQAMGEQGGWPLTMFLTSDARPFWGGTYFPKVARYGRPGFVAVLEAVADTWRERRDELDRSAGALSAHVAGELAPTPTDMAAKTSGLEPFAEAIHAMIDRDKGGLRGAPKFPNAPMMQVLRLSWQRNGIAAHRDAVVASLRAMLSGGIYDHIGGGLCRYSTDAEWLVPHFEKMLYDNAQLMDLAGWAYAETGDELFRIRIEETIAWLGREMLVAGGGFASSLDADSDGEEGRFYLWTRDEIVAVLGKDDAERFLDVYELAQPSQWEGDPILHRLSSPGLGPADTDAALRAMKARLLEARNRRNSPGRDDKILVDWNGLAIAALAGAARQFARHDWLELAKDAFRFVAESADGERLPHSIAAGRRLFPGLASDYGAMISAAVALSEATGDGTYLEKARRWQDALDRWHGDEDGIGHYLTAVDALDVPMRIRGESTRGAVGDCPIVETMTRLAMLGFTAGSIAGRPAPPRRCAARHRATPGRHRQCRGAFWRCRGSSFSSDDPTAGHLVSAHRFPAPARVGVLIPAGWKGRSRCPPGHRREGSRRVAVRRPGIPAARGAPARLEKPLRAGREAQVFIRSKKSALVLVCFSLSIRNSMASVVPMAPGVAQDEDLAGPGAAPAGLPCGCRISICPWPESLSATRSSTISELPVPLNSPKITVHAVAGVDQRRGDDGQRAAFLDVARRTEEALRSLDALASTPGQHLA